MISCRFPVLSLRLLIGWLGAGWGTVWVRGCCFVVCGAYQHTYMTTPSAAASLRANFLLVSLLPPLSSLWRHAHFLLNHPLAVCPLGVSLRAKRSLLQVQVVYTAVRMDRGAMVRHLYSKTMEEPAIIKSTTYLDSLGGSQRTPLLLPINSTLRHVSEVHSD